MKGYIYALKCPIIDQIRYIGQTVQKPSYRYNNHLNEIKKPKYNTKKVNWLKKVLRNNLLPELIILEEIDNCTKELLNEREIYWISENKDLPLVNGNEGGNNVCKAIQKYHRRTIDKKVYSYNEFTKELIEYKNIEEAGKQVNVNKHNIPKAIYIKGRCKGLFWSYDKNFQIKESKHYTKIAVFNDNFYKEYNSIFEAMDDLNIPRTCKSRIGYRLNDGLEYKGFYFKRLHGKSNAGKKSKGSALIQ